jgi:hypothetical protein
MAFAFNPITGKLDLVGSGGGGGNPFDQSLNTTDGVSFSQVTAEYLTTGFDNGVILNPDSTALFRGISRAGFPPQPGTFGFDTDNSNFVCRKSASGPLATIYDTENLTIGTLTGGKTPAYLSVANSFTQGQSITAPANTSALTASYSVTGANTTPLLNLSATWNTTGIARGILLNVTDTASNASSRLLDLQYQGTTSFAVGKDGSLTFNSTAASGSGSGSLTPGNTPIFNLLQSNGLRSSISPTTITFFTASGSTNPVMLTADAANTLAQRNGTNSQTFRLYNTFTDSANFERGFMRWNSNVLEIGTEAGGTGTARLLKLQGAAQVDIFTFGTIQSARFSSVQSIIYNALAFGGATLAANPSTTDLNAGRAGVWKNSTTGVVSLWYNDGGTMKSVALA